MSFQYEASQIPELTDVAMELKSYIESLGSDELTKKGNRWVSDPNFVTVTIQSARARQLAITVWGNPEKHINYQKIALQTDRPSYSIFRVTSHDQLEDAKDCIKRAATLKGVC